MRLMREIYTRAKRVLVSLDTGDGSSGFGWGVASFLNDLYIKTFIMEKLYTTSIVYMLLENSHPWIKRLSAGPPFHVSRRRVFSPEDNESMTRLTGYQIPVADVLTESVRSALRAFFGSPWFTRIWCVQEIVLARKAVVLFGYNEELSWRTVGTGAEWLFEEKYLAEIRDPDLCGIRVDGAYNMFNSKMYRENELLLALTDFRHCASTDPRDKVYALLGIVRWDSGVPPLEIDYQKSVREVYIDAATAILRSSNDLSLLSAVQSRAAETPLFLPTWVPSWESSKDAPQVNLRDLTLWSACSDRGMQDWHLLPSGCLVLRGYIFDTATSTSWPFTYHDDEDLLDPNHPASDAIFELTKHVFQRSLEARNSKEMLKAMAYTLTMGAREEANPWRRIAQQYSRQRKTTNHALAKDVKEVVEAGNKYYFVWDCLDFIRLLEKKRRDRLQYPAFEETKGQGYRYLSIVSLNLNHRRIFHTKDGHFGIGPERMKAGDFVVVLRGGRVPYVLRPLGAEYMFIGTCYLHAIMGGQMFQESWNKEWKEETFVLQ